MDNILLNCLVVRIFTSFRRVYSQSVLSRFFSGIKEAYLKSVLCRLLCGILSRPSKAQDSRLYKILDKFNCALSRFGTRICHTCVNSFIYRVCSGINNSKFLAKSAAFRFVKSLGLRGALIACFGMYLPIDFIVRDVLNSSLLGSVWDELFMGVCILYILGRIAFSGDRPVKPRISPLDAPLSLFLAIGVLVLAMVSPYMGIAISGYRAVCQFMLWFFVLTRLIEDDRDLKIFFLSFCFMGIFVALHGVYQYITGAPMPSTWVAAAEKTGMRTRVYSITGSPNIMGALMIMVAPAFAALAYYVKTPKAKLFAWCATAVVCVAALLTFSRGAWFGLAIAVVLFCLLVDIRLLFLAAIAVFGLIVFVPAIGTRIGFLFTSEFEHANNNGGRAGRWEIGLNLLSKNPVWGFGLGRFGGAIAMQNQTEAGLQYFYMDNYYLKTLVEMGYVGLSAYILLLLSNIVNSLKGFFQSRKTRLCLLAVGLFCGMAGVLAHSYFENIFEVPYMNAYFWGMSAAIMYVCYFRKKEI